MASKEVEVLDPAPTVEKLKKSAPERVLNRRHFIAALGVAGAAVAGTELVRSGPTALAQQPKPNGYAQSDVLNFLLNVKYLKATLYSYITQGVDLPAATFTNLGTGGVFLPPKQVTFTAAGPATAQEVTDLFNAMYYDEVNDLVTLRSILGSAVYPRQTMNLQGTGTSTATAGQTVTPVQAISLLRMLEDLSASAFAGATIYLTGTNLQYATQALAVNGFHAGALRLIAIQSGAPYYSPQDLTSTGPTTQTQNSFTASTVAGSTTIYNFAPTNPITTGSILTGPGIPVNTTITSVNPPTVYTGTLSGTATIANSQITNVAPTSNLAVGQAISGTGIPANSIITAISGTTITIGVVTGYSSLTPPTPITNGVIGVTGTGGTGMTVGTYPLAFSGGGGSGAAGTLTVLTATTFSAIITASGQGYTTAPTVTAATGGTPPTLTAAIPAQITTTSASTTLTLGFLAATTKGSLGLLYVTPTAGLIPGQILSGTNLPSNNFIAQAGITAAAGTVLMGGAVASATSSVAPTGFVTKGTAIITQVSSVSGILTGLPITGTGIPAGTTVSSFDPIGLTITMSTTASTTTTGTSSVTPTGFLTKGTTTVTALSSLTGLAAGNTVTGGGTTGIPTGTTVVSVGGINTMVLSSPASATTVPTVKPTGTGVLASGNNIVSYVFPTGNFASGNLITDSQGNIPPGTTVTGVTAASNTITLSAPATGSSTVTTLSSFTGTVVVSYETISSVPASAFTTTPPIAVGMPISGTNIPSGTVITALSASAGTITISQFPTAAAGAEVTAFSTPPAAFVVTTTETLTPSTLQTITVTAPTLSEAVTVPTLVMVTPSLGTATLSQAPTTTGIQTVIVEGTDNMDVEPYDPGTAALASNGPAALAGTSPSVYAGFFDTAGASTSSTTNPAGATFARTFSQVLAVLYGSTASQTYQGGFFPNGVSGSINFV